MTSTNKDMPENQEELPSESTEGVTASPNQPSSTHSATTKDIPEFGWSGYAERINGRFAMVGFATVLLIEALSGETFLHWAGFIP